MSASPRTVPLPASLEGALRSGHPWVYRNHVPESDLRTGDLVRVEAGSFASHGVFDASGAIAVRLFGEVPTRQLIQRRVATALTLRAGLAASGTDAHRLVYGEGDYLPGIVCDRYGRYAIMKGYSQGIERFLPDVATEVGKQLGLRGVALRRSRGGDSLEALWGELPPPELTIRENGLTFVADPWHGHKTGLFLDQRDNRKLVGSVAGGKRVLNLFSYSGAFSVYALAGGATFALSVDSAKPALEAAERNVAMNEPAGDHSVLAADIFDALPRWVEQGQKYDLVVLDPPSLANDASQQRKAQRAYMRLNRDALRLVTPGGYLATASCTAQISPARFREIVAEAGRAAGVEAQVVAERGHAVDHPVPLSFPEGRYLKFLLLRVPAY